MTDTDTPESVEEAGALLGAAITRYGTDAHSTIVSPPKGMHSSFAANSPVPSSELLVRLHSLRALLRSAPQDVPLVAAPSLLAGVLMKLLGVSSSIAAAPIDPARPRRIPTPPMLSTAMRRLWVDCVVLCHNLGEGLSGNARVSVHGFVRNMISLAGMNPRSARAAGGNRVAALEAIAGLFEDSRLQAQLASWALDVIQLVQRALKSSGNGEPTYRVASIHTACAVAVACRQSSLKLRPREGSAVLVLKGALEDRGIIEAVKALRLATIDKFPEVRAAAATFAGLLAPVLIHTGIKSPQSPEAPATSATMSLEDVMTLAFKNLDDESPDVAAAWADSLSRCMCTAIEYSNQLQAENSSRRSADGEGPAAGPNSSEPSNRRKGVVPASVCSSFPNAIKFLVGHFVKVGGELVAPRAGGTFSTGGRAVRLGFARTLVQLFRVQSQLQTIGEGRGIPTKDAILIILTMVGSDMEMQLNAPDRSAPRAESLDATSVVPRSSQDGQPTSNPLFGQVPAASPLFGQQPKKSHADAGIARMAANRVLRDGIVEIAPETAQLSILHDLIDLCGNKLNGNQLQVCLIEISHILVALGEAAASTIDDIVPAFKRCLRHHVHGVRHEAAVAVAALASVFPTEGRNLVQTSVNDIQLEHAELMAIASVKKVEEAPETGASRFLRFGKRAPAPKEVKEDESLKHQYAVHGLSLMISMVVRDLPSLPGGLPTALLGTVLSVAEILASTLFNGIMTNSNPSAACTSVRAGFGIICGALTTGPMAVSNHIALIFGLWQKVKQPSERSQKFTADHDLICIDAMLSSIVAFLRHCSELLLSIPDALSRTSLILEEILPLFLQDGRLGKTPANPAAASRLQSAKASIMEAFSWLPPGSYPMAADSVFDFAAGHIQAAVDDGVTNSMLGSLVSKEDMLLDAVSYSRANRTGQVGGARDLDQDILMRTSEVAHHGERESVLYFLAPESHQTHQLKEQQFRGSEVLGLFAYNQPAKPPTPLHAVGTWRSPVNPSCSSKVRLVDAAIEAFSATFGLKSGKEQQSAMHLLESMLLPISSQTARPMGVTAALAEQDRRGKSKEENAASANIITVLLSCLQALPLHESSNNVPIGLGPPWMSKAKDMLLALLPSAPHVVRRAAAEGLGLLATLGVSEDAHFLQSTVLHSLDEVMQGNQPDGKQKAIPLDSVSAARAGSLLTLACIQRTAYDIQQKRSSRSRGRGSADDGEDELPTLQMMTRVLPSISCHGIRDYFLARTYALHSFGLLFAYSNRLEKSLNAEDEHLLKKGVEIVEDNFLAAWTTASNDYDRGNEGQKMASQASFLAVLLRLMTFFIPSLHHLKCSDPGIATRFSTMATIILEVYGLHATVITEAMGFFEVLAANQELLAPPSSYVVYSENPILSCIPFLIRNVSPCRAEIQPVGRWHGVNGCLASRIGMRATLRAVKLLSLSQILIAEWSDMKLVSVLYAALEASCGSRFFSGETFYRSLAAPREAELVYSGGDPTEREMVDVIRLLLYVERSMSKRSTAVLLRWMLLSHTLLSGASFSDSEDDNEEGDGSYNVAGVTRAAASKAFSDALPILEVANPVRWQAKSTAVQMATTGLVEITKSCKQDGMLLVESPNFNLKVAQSVCSEECSNAASSGFGIPNSRLAFHLSAVVTTTCATSTATVDQAELQILQESALYMLVEVVLCFGRIPDPEQPDSCILTEFLPQISSCIKYALGAVNERDGEMPCRLFMAGCAVLRAFIKVELAADHNVVKRIARAALPTPEEVPFFEHDVGLPNEFFKIDEEKKQANHRASLLQRVGKFWALDALPSGVLAEVKADAAELGVHSSALAIDGACLLLGSGLSLCGDASNEKKDEQCSHFESGFLYRNITDIDDSVRSSLVKTWATNCCNGVRFLTKAIISEEQRHAACLVWLNKTVPLLFVGLRHAIDALKPTKRQKPGARWASSVDARDVAANCIKGMSLLVQSAGTVEFNDEWKAELEIALSSISQDILRPSLGDPGTATGEKQPELTIVSCDLMKHLATTTSVNVSERSALLMSLLHPLNLLQTGSLDLSNDTTSVIIAACLASVSSLVSHSKAPSSLVKAMVPLVLQVVSTGNPAAESVKVSARLLLKECLSHEVISSGEHSRIAIEMAKQSNWSAWAVVCEVHDGAAASGSMDIVQNLLLDSNNWERQRAALLAVRELAQGTPTPSPLVGRIVFAVGAEVLSVLQAYAKLAVPKEAQEHRTATCAHSMKIVLTGYQQLSSDGSGDEIMIGFLLVVFEAFIDVIRYNGLPNHPPPQSGSDSALGRMCAQAITHVARTTPIPFKSSMASMTDHDRAVLEFAVRAEMSGYAAPAGQAPAKKKINLKGFKK